VSTCRTNKDLPPDESCSVLQALWVRAFLLVIQDLAAVSPSLKQLSLPLPARSELWEKQQVLRESLLPAFMILRIPVATYNYLWLWQAHCHQQIARLSRHWWYRGRFEYASQRQRPTKAQENKSLVVKRALSENSRSSDWQKTRNIGYGLGSYYSLQRCYCICQEISNWSAYSRGAQFGCKGYSLSWTWFKHTVKLKRMFCHIAHELSRTPGQPNEILY